jgi:hypothetical protein
MFGGIAHGEGLMDEALAELTSVAGAHSFQKWLVSPAMWTQLSIGPAFCKTFVLV